MNINEQRLRKIKVAPKSIADYRPLIPQVVEEIYRLARNLPGLELVHVNATAVGGGVAETLRSQVALWQDVGFNCSWYILPKNQSFFGVSKEIHNFLHGKPGELTSGQKKIYLNYSRSLGLSIASIKPRPDILVIHDPQPAAAVAFLTKERPRALIWRCHIDASSANKEVWNFLAPYLGLYDHYIFSGKNDIYKPWIPPRDVALIAPAIDPFTEKNRPLPKIEAQKILGQLGINISKPLVTQISRFDPWKDPLGVIDAFRLAKKQIPDLQLALVAQQAGDDPEGQRMYHLVKKYIRHEKDIFLFVDLENNDKAINAFQTASDIILQKSLKEGFGLTVTEAMWKGAIVIAGNVGGIRLQIKNKVNGFLINSTGEMAEKIIYILKNPHLKETLGREAYETVKNKFLLPHELLSELKLFRRLADLKPRPLTRPAHGSLFVHRS